MVAASFFVETNYPSKYRLSNKKDIADDPTLVVTPKLFFKNSCFLVYESLGGLTIYFFTDPDTPKKYFSI